MEEFVLEKGPLAALDILPEASVFLVVRGKMFGSRDDLEVVRIVSLQAFDKRHAQAAGEPGVFAVGLLRAPPARIASHVDHRRPEREYVAVSAEMFARRGIPLTRAPSEIAEAI